MTRTLLLACALAGLAFSTARAQTVGDLAARGTCSTDGTEGINEQLVRTHRCLFPGAFVEFAPYPGITLTSARVYPLSSAEARGRIQAAADAITLEVSSAFRTLAQQLVLYESGACGLAASPGTSNHETGRAVDLVNWSAARDAMIAAGCTHPFPMDDPVHFECGGPDMRMASVLAFQTLWNRNNPGDAIAEDGVYGPQTDARLHMSPAAGFALEPCDEPMPDAGVPDSDAGAEADASAGLPDGAVRVYMEPERGCSCRAAGEAPGGRRGAASLWLVVWLVAVRQLRRIAR